MSKATIHNVAKEFNIGKTHIKICTDYCVQSTNEITKILNNIAEICLSNINYCTQKNNN